MLVRDLGDAYQLVLQPDHGRLSGQLAAAWRLDSGLSAEVREGLVLAATRHDDGWAVWERDPRLDDDGRPQNFLGVPLRSLLSSYRACADVVAAENPTAGLFVSMHVSGLQRGRYGMLGGSTTALDEIEPPMREFVVAEEQRQQELMSTLSVSEEERWKGYRLLQFFDVLSLYFGLADLEQGDSWTVGTPPEGAPPATADHSDLRGIEITSAGQPWAARCDPFPFSDSPLRLQMTRRVLPKRDWTGDAGFRSDFWAAPVEQVQLAIAGPSS